jgi:hypothetical protein
MLQSHRKRHCSIPDNIKFRIHALNQSVSCRLSQYHLNEIRLAWLLGPHSESPSCRLHRLNQNPSLWILKLKQIQKSCRQGNDLVLCKSPTRTLSSDSVYVELYQIITPTKRHHIMFHRNSPLEELWRFLFLFRFVLLLNYTTVPRDNLCTL